LYGASTKIKCYQFQRQLTELLQYVLDSNKYLRQISLDIPDLQGYKKDLIWSACIKNSNFFYFHFNYLRKMLLLVYQAPYPHKGITLISKIPRLGELYFACAVLADLACIFDVVPRHTKITSLSEKYHRAREDLKWAVRKIRSLVFSVTENSLLKLDKDHDTDFKSILPILLCLQTYHRLLILYLEDSNIRTFCCVGFLPFSSTYPGVEQAVEFLIAGNYKKLGNYIQILSDKSQVRDSDNKFCRRCGKQENTATQKFLQCKQCVESNFPEMNYFCSKTCQKIMLKSEHLAEHLEFELGLAE
jgi:hypothetical protein